MKVIKKSIVIYGKYGYNFIVSYLKHSVKEELYYEKKYMDGELLLTEYGHMLVLIYTISMPLFKYLYEYC